MHDIKFIRDNPDAFDKAMEKRGEDKVAKKLLELDEKVREKQTELQELQTKRNDIAKAIGAAKSKGEDAAELFKEADKVKKQVPALEEEMAKIKSRLNLHLISLPNLLAEDVPVGEDESDNIEIRKVGEPRKFDFTPKEHFELGEDLGMMDFETAAKLSGSRFVILKDELAKLERALAAFMIDIHTKDFGYSEMMAPVLVRNDAMFGTGQLPKFAEDSFKTTNDYWLIPTSEVALTNFVADSIISEEELPYRFVAYSQCFRSEAGSAGKDTRGMIRQHQFSKVELVSITTEKESEEEHERMTSAAEEVLKRLDLPYRVVTLCSGDVGFSSTKTYDIEVWLPGQSTYREISSCSNCKDFQARRMKARYKGYNDKKNYFVHTLNGSGLAIGRTMVAILENYQNEDGTISIPVNLQPYMGGLTKIGGK